MLLSRFWNDTRGGVGPMLALSIVPLMAAVGVAVDYSRANAARAAFQAAVDSASLTLSKTAAANSDLSGAATTLVRALITRPDTTGINVTAVYSSNGGTKVTMTGTATVASYFMSSIPISASAVSTWGNTRLRVALVLDNTGSMQDDNKMTALKTAAQNLLTQLKNAATTADDVYVSIIPFSKDVNLGASNSDQAWLRWDLWEPLNGTCSSSKYTTQSSCQSHSKVWTPASHSTWNGCVTDRDQNFDTTNDAPVAGSTLYPTEQYSSCPAAVLGLSNDWTALSGKITAMQPAGNTNQAIGLQVGWQSLTASPFTVPAKDPNYTYEDVIILLTDGLNTQDRWYTNQSSIDTREQKTCTNVKNAGIVLYTVQVNTGGDPTSTLLQNCASDSSKFFLLTSSDQIVATFDQIGTSLTKLRLSM
jgi:Flp pilus assembly protein TadG